jgi:hypothetical protein
MYILSSKKPSKKVKYIKNLTNTSCFVSMVTVKTNYPMKCKLDIAQGHTNLWCTFNGP